MSKAVIRDGDWTTDGHQPPLRAYKHGIWLRAQRNKTDRAVGSGLLIQQLQLVSHKRVVLRVGFERDLRGPPML